jgi:hypothetical protein
LQLQFSIYKDRRMKLKDYLKVKLISIVFM